MVMALWLGKLFVNPILIVLPSPLPPHQLLPCLCDSVSVPLKHLNDVVTAFYPCPGLLNLSYPKFPHDVKLVRLWLKRYVYSDTL